MLTSEYTIVLTKALLVSTLLLMKPAQALELVMIEQAGCHFCARFNAEIAPAYPKTPEGQKAPLRRIDLSEPWPEDLSNIRKETLTPTFVLVHDNQELGRLHGYPGDEYFWFRLNLMLDAVEL